MSDQLYAKALTLFTSTGTDITASVGGQRILTDGTDVYFNGVKVSASSSNVTNNFTISNDLIVGNSMSLSGNLLTNVGNIVVSTGPITGVTNLSMGGQLSGVTNILVNNVLSNTNPTGVGMFFGASNIRLTSNLVLLETAATLPNPGNGQGLQVKANELYFNGTKIGAASTSGNAFSVTSTDTFTSFTAGNVITVTSNLQVGSFFYANSANITTTRDFVMNKAGANIVCPQNTLSVYSNTLELVSKGIANVYLQAADLANTSHVHFRSTGDSVGAQNKHAVGRITCVPSSTLSGVSGGGGTVTFGARKAAVAAGTDDGLDAQTILAGYSSNISAYGNVFAIGPDGDADNVRLSVGVGWNPANKLSVGTAASGEAFGVSTVSNTVALGTSVTVGYTSNVVITSSAGNMVQIGTGTASGSGSVAIGRLSAAVGTNSVSIGSQAGQSNQNTASVAIGFGAGNSLQNAFSVAIGYQAGQSTQNAFSVAIGYQAGQASQGSNSVAIGASAGQTSQGPQSVAIGFGAGQSSQSSNCVAVGFNAGQTSQSSNCVAIGFRAAETNQNVYSIAIGHQAGSNLQNAYSVAIGFNAGQSSQSSYAVAVGNQAGQIGQSSNSVAIGNLAGYSGQRSQSVAIGLTAGSNTQGVRSVAIGAAAGESNQGSGSVAVGSECGQNNQGESCVAIGNGSGKSTTSRSVAIGFQAGNSQKSSAIAIGENCGSSAGSGAIAIGGEAARGDGTSGKQASYAIAIGFQAGSSLQNAFSVAIGFNAGQSSQSSYAVAVGNQAGNNLQSSNCIAVGRGAGYNTQGTDAVAIGTYAGSGVQKVQAVAIGAYAGQSTQSSYATAIGLQAGQVNQGQSAIAIGPYAGNSGQANHSIAIGSVAGRNGIGSASICIGYMAGSSTAAFPANSICLNASGNNFTSSTANACYISPIRSVASTGQVLFYNTSTFEVSYAAKAFVIDHPDEPDTRYLVHTCLEGPEVGVYYRGQAQIEDGDSSAEVFLPKYVKNLIVAETASAIVTPIFNGKKVRSLNVGEYDSERNSFFVYGDEPGKFNWTFTASRGNCYPEPLKTDVVRKGNGPYTWIEPVV